MARQKKFKDKKMRKKQRDNGYFELSDVYHADTKRVSIDRKKIFEDINNLKEKIILNSNSGNQKKADKFLKFLLENQKEKEYLIKSLSDISTKIDNIEFKIRILNLAYEYDNHDTVTLNSYATALANSGESQKSFEFFEKSLRIDENDTVTLSSYATALANGGESQKSFEFFEKSLRIDENNTVTLNSYATALANGGESQKSFEFFEKSLRIDANNIVTLFSFGLFLKSISDYPKAIEMFKRALALDILDYRKNYLYLMLGELYFYNGQKILGEKYFKRFIDNSKNKDKARIESALVIFKKNPYDESGSKLLLEVSSTFIKEASDLFSVSATQKLFYKFFNNDKNRNSNIIDSTLELNRAIYHKIENQISILRALFDMAIIKERDEGIKGKLKKTELKVLEIFKIIKDKKNIEKENIRLNKNDFNRLIEAISKIAHNITDKINNKLHVIKTRLMMIKKDFPQIDNQIKTTVATLNNLKDLKQGSLSDNIATFELQELLKNLRHNMQLKNALIDFKIINGEINSDKQKITECINELIENSIRHNSEMDRINIFIQLEIVENPTILREKREGEYLRVIYTDNGKGIKDKNKEWIFNPLNSTIENGSGLGLFILKRIVEKLEGRIYEDGTDGARFNMYIPNKLRKNSGR
jgi:signal transduction histidine kinase/Tfp pilus assembly protein PilF